MAKSKNGKAATAGLLMLLFGGVWKRTHDYLVKRAIPPGWIVDLVPYWPAVTLAGAGLFVLLVTAVIGMVKYRRQPLV